jgi:hypothetical protein
MRRIRNSSEEEEEEIIRLPWRGLCGRAAAGCARAAASGCKGALPVLVLKKRGGARKPKTTRSRGGPEGGAELQSWLHRRSEVIRWRRDRSVDRCSMTRDAPTAAGGCFTGRTSMPALPMPYNGGRVDSASRTFSPDEDRGAYAK